MSNRQKVLKDFAELRPIEDKIALVARGIMQIAFKGAALTDWEPREGTQVHRVWKAKRLDERQQIAWQTFIDDVLTAEGNSGNVGGSYGDFHDKSNDGFKVPKAYVNRQYKRLEALWVFLDRSERALLTELLQDYFHGKSSLKLEAIGLIRSGYSEKETSRVAGVVHIQCLLTRLASFYGV